MNTGQSLFTLMSHPVYDAGLYRYVADRIWQCPTEVLLDQYRVGLSATHLEIGVGTGVLLDRTLDQVERPDLTLMDVNQACLRKAAHRLARFEPRCLRRNVLRPLGADSGPYTSVGMNFVLHCIEGGSSRYAAIFENIGSVLREGGVFFGATVMASGVPHTRTSRWLMGALNNLGVFHNRRDDLQTLTKALTDTFSDVRIDCVGCVALFSALR